MNGGYKLARDPREITALGVIGAINGPVLLTSCFGEGGRLPPLGSLHRPGSLTEGTRGDILRLLAGISIGDMLQEGQPADCAPAVTLPIEITAGFPVVQN